MQQGVVKQRTWNILVVGAIWNNSQAPVYIIQVITIHQLLKALKI